MKSLNAQVNMIRARRRLGLTLIELVVVMTILIALGGLLIPVFASMLTRGHTSTCATNMGEVAKAVEQYQLLQSAYPNNLDALSDGTNLVNYLAGGAALPASYGGPGTTTSMAAGQITGLTLTALEATALQNAGITTVQSMTATAAALSTGFDPTFNNYSDYLTPGTTAANAIAIAAGKVVGGLDPSANPAAAVVCNHLNLPLTGRYALLGVGPRSSMIGVTMQSAPVHYGDVPALNPEYGYERICAIIKISDSAIGANYTNAQLIGAAPIHNDGVGSVNDELQNWYQLQQGES